MLDHIGIQVDDFHAATAFYDAVLAPLGYGRVMDGGQQVAYGPPEFPAFWVSPRLEDSRNREVHLAFRAPDETAVRAFHQAALAQGAEEMHAPRAFPEYHPRYFAAFVRDPDGNNVEAVIHRHVASGSPDDDG